MRRAHTARAQLIGSLLANWFLFEFLNLRSPYVCVRGDLKMNVETATVLVAGISVIIAAINSIYSSREAKRQAS